MPSCWPVRNKKKVAVNTSVIDAENSKKQSAAGSAKDSLMRKWVQFQPLETAKILEIIFRNLTVNELLQIRQVSKRWNLAACTILREKIEGAIILQRGLSYFTRAMSRSLEIPIGRVFLKIDDMDDPSAIKFFQVIGPSILFLVLNLEGSSLAGFLGQIHNLKNLKQLSLNLFKEEDMDFQEKDYRKRKATSIKIFIEDYDNHDSSIGETLANLESFVMSCEPDWKSNEALLLEKLLEMSPNLKNLNLNKWPFILKPNIFQKCQFESLNFLSVKSLDDQGFNILGQKKLKCLKTLECELSHDLTQESFQSFLENVSNILEYIEIKSQHDPNLYFKLPVVMKELNTIRLPTWVGHIMLDSILTCAPKLQKIQLSYVNPANVYVKDSVRQSPTVTYLAVNFGNGSHSMKTTSKTLKNFVAAFPNLKIFMMKKVSDKLLEIICEGWPKLEALRITTSFALSDSGITGLPASGLQKINKSEDRLNCGCCVPVSVVNGQAQCDSSRVTPHIALLRNLKDLRIEAEQGTNWTLTNLSLHLGINELQRLNSLKLTCHELGPHWCLRCIADNLAYLQHLTIMDRAISHDRYDEQELSYLLRKLPNLNLTFAEADSYSSNR